MQIFIVVIHDSKEPETTPVSKNWQMENEIVCLCDGIHGGAKSRESPKPYARHRSPHGIDSVYTKC